MYSVIFAQYDMALHTDKYNLSPDEMSKLWCDLREETSLVTIGDEVVGGQSGFAHIAGACLELLVPCEKLLTLSRDNDAQAVTRQGRSRLSW